MANPRSKVLPQIFTVYLFIMFAHCVDVFYVDKLGGDAKVLGTNLYGHVVGIIVVFVACLVDKKDVRSYGLILKPKRVAKGLVKGFIFSVIPIAAVAALSFFVYLVFGFEWAKPSFIPPNINYSGGIGATRAAIVFALAIFVSVFMKELFFRGYVLRYARPTYPFFDANIVQAVLCIPIPLVNHLKNVAFNTYGDAMERLPLMIAIGLFYIVSEFMMAIKWGLLARVSKDLWPMIFDHYIYNFFGYCLFVQTSKLNSVEQLVRLFLVQAISFVMVYIYYKRKRAEKEKKVLEKRLKKIQRRAKRQENGESDRRKKKNESHAKHNEEMLENFSHEEIQDKIDNFSNDNLHRHHHRHHHHHSGSSHSDHKDDKLMDLDEIEISDFYLEYAKEMELKSKKDLESAKKQIQSSQEE